MMIDGSVRVETPLPPLDYPGGGYAEPVSYPALDYPASGDYSYPVTAPDTGGSYWDSLLSYGKEIGKVFTQAYVKQFLPQEDKGALQYQAPPPAPPERLDYLMTTPYPRKDSGTVPSPTIIPAPAGGFPMPLLLIGGGLALLMLMKRR